MMICYQYSTLHLSEKARLSPYYNEHELKCILNTLYTLICPPQYRRAALSSCVGCLTAHPSPPGTDPQELKHTMGENTAHLHSHIATPTQITARHKDEQVMTLQTQASPKSSLQVPQEFTDPSFSCKVK